MSDSPGPPPYVPTLTQIVHPALPTEPTANVAAETADAAEDASAAAHAQLVARVLQHVDLLLEPRLHEAMEQLIRAQLHELMPRLQEEIELVVRETVTQAFERESGLNSRF